MACVALANWAAAAAAEVGQQQRHTFVLRSNGTAVPRSLHGPQSTFVAAAAAAAASATAAAQQQQQQPLFNG